MGERWTVVEAKTVQLREHRGNVWRPAIALQQGDQREWVFETAEAFPSGLYRLRILIERDDDFDPKEGG